MNKSNRFRRLIYIGVASVVGLASASVLAGVSSWSYANYNYGTYVPLTGSFTEGISGGRYTSRMTFSFTNSNVTSINEYNNGAKAGCSKSAYLTLDQTAVPDGWDLEIDAYSIYTTLPNPTFDFEDNNFFGEDDESEVVAKGAILANTSYYMRTYWTDNRDGGSNDSGKIQGQFAMSQLGFSDYNNCMQAGAVQIINPYGDHYGSL
jgi:hypothetical protein